MMKTKNNLFRLLKVLVLFILFLQTSLVWAQDAKRQLVRQQLTFSLYNQAGEQLTLETLKTKNIKVYSTRETSVSFYPKITFDAETNYFTFSEPVMSPGIALAFVSPTQTMFISIHGPFGVDRTIEGIVLQNGSYLLSSNDFGSKTLLKVTNWEKYLEDGMAPEKQDLGSYKSSLKGRTPVAVSVLSKIN